MCLRHNLTHQQAEDGVLPSLFLNGIVPLYAPDTTGVPVRIFI